MSIEVQTEEPDVPLAEFPAASFEGVDETAEAPPAKPATGKPTARANPNKYVPLAERQAASPVARAIKANQDKSLRELIESFGSEGSYQINVERKEPDSVFDPVAQRTWNTQGFCGKFENKPIDEDFIEKRYGGGVYEIKFKERKASGSGWQYAGQLTVKIQGEPNLADLRQKAGIVPGGTPTATAAAQGDNPSIVKETMSILNRQLERAEDRGKADTGGTQMLALLQGELAAARQQMSAMQDRYENALSTARAQPAAPVRSPIEEKMFSSLLDGDSARLTQLRDTHASELRTVKEVASEDLKRQAARFDAQIQDMKHAHEREITVIRQSHEVSMAAAKSSHEVQLAALKSSSALESKVLEQDNKRLERENDRLAAEVKELRAKKDLSPIEMLKQVETIKNALGAGEEEESSTAGKIVEAVTNPGFFEGVGAMIESFKTKPPPQQQATAQGAQEQAVAKQGRKVVQTPDGKRFMLMPDGQLVGPLKKKRKAGEPAAEGEEGAEEAPAEAGPVMPKIDPAVISASVSFLESACGGNQDPKVVAQGWRSRVPDELVAAIRDHGVDVVIGKMAKLPGSSPLSSQRGRNWLREFGTALVGE